MALETPTKSNPLWSALRAASRNVNRRQFLGALGVGGAVALLPSVAVSEAGAAFLPGAAPIFEASTEPIQRRLHAAAAPLRLRCAGAEHRHRDDDPPPYEAP